MIPLLILASVTILTASSIVIYAERNSEEHTWTFIDSLWWGLMMLSTGKCQIYAKRTK